MKKEYDFSKGERGKFYKEDMILNYPVYLEPENLKFIQEIAKKSKVDINTIVNDLIKNNIKLAKVLNS
jgi:hypothetical protein